MNSQTNNLRENIRSKMDKQFRPSRFAKENIKELNRSMESIQKMIERSRRIINQSRDIDRGKYSLQKMKENAQNQVEPLKGSSNTHQITSHRHPLGRTVHRQINLSGSFQNHILMNTVNLTASPNSSLGKKTSNHEDNVKIGPNSQKFYVDSSQQLISDIKLNKEDTCSAIGRDKNLNSSPYRDFKDPVKQMIKFSPQRTNKKEINRSLEKNSSAKTQKHKLKFYQNNQLEHHNRQKRQNILIEEDDMSPDFNRPNLQINKQYRFKTEYESDQSNYQPNREDVSINSEIKYPRKKINLKSINTDIKKTERQKKAANIPLKLSARQNLVKELQQLETQSANDQQRKAKFILKIKKYGFVEKHLSQQEIWGLYQKLVQSDIPEIKWPILIVDEVYRKMKLKN